MTTYEILVATDDSEYGRKAEIAAMKISRSYNIRIAAIYIAVGHKDSEREERIAKGENALNRVVETGAAMGVEINKILVGVSMQRMPQKGAMADTIARAILDAAEKYKVHTIVLGGKGESEINPELGSVALAVVKKAKCTVLVAR
ncbi:MAG: universal stress protein [Candidatus Methanoperedens sp.]|nr:universal stress protein [Candidatus Methanoperedens sp.]MCE8428754.1 universal stress protein [Candidatus Methanoperedens sp.]